MTLKLSTETSLSKRNNNLEYNRTNYLLKLRQMKTMFKTGALLIALVFSVKAVQSQDTQELVVPLSEPGKSGLLHVSLHTGSISVSGYSGQDVIVKVHTEQKKYERETRDGLRRIPNRSLGVTVREERNYVKVSSSHHNKDIALEIQVPTDFDLKLSGHNDGFIRVENVKGELDVQHHNEDITLLNITGSAVVNSHNGDIKVTFDGVTADTPMAFSTYNGDIDITFPTGVKATTKMKSERGEILTDFDMTVRKAEPRRETSRNNGVYKISIDEYVIADINGGGPEILFKNYNGDIILRKK